MDLTRPVVFRAVNLNTVTLVNGALVGCAVEQIDYSDVDVTQFTEKRAGSDGLDASEVTLGARRIGLSGTVYAATRPGLEDAIQALRGAMNPKLSFREEEDEAGYRPLTFSKNSGVNGVIPVMLKARPNGLRYRYIRTRDGGSDSDPASATFRAQFLMRDPLVYAVTPQEVVLTSATTDVSGTFVHRGDYPAPLTVRLVSSAAAGIVDIAIGGKRIFITVDAAPSRVLLYQARETTLDDGGTLAMDQLTYASVEAEPIMVDPGSSDYHIMVSGGCLSSGEVFFNEAWA